MAFVYFIIIGIPLLLTFHFARKLMKACYIKRNGSTVNAAVTTVRTMRFRRSYTDVLALEYKDASGRVYSVFANADAGKFKPGDSLPISYLPANPLKYAVNGGKGYWILLILCILISAFMVFAAFKLEEMLP